MKRAPLCVSIVGFMLLSGCSWHEGMRGVNLLQSHTIAFGDEATRQSLSNLADLGANTVAIVVFLQQDSNNASSMRFDEHMSLQGVARTIRWARELGLKVVLKPQLLVDDGWAGAIEAADWEAWFDEYTNYLYAFALLAQQEGVEILVVGTELNHTASLPGWKELIVQVRTVYSGELSYTAHGIQGLREFGYWQELDSASVSLYPSLGDTQQDSRQRIEQVLEELKKTTDALEVPLWVAEVGIASRANARQQPWVWKDLHEQEQVVDLRVQNEVIDLWLENLGVSWLQGVLLWSWSNDPHAGGADDYGFSLQNKPVQDTIAEHWQRSY